MNILPWDQRERVLVALTRGMSALGVSRASGVARTTLSRWAILAGMTFSLGHHGGVTAADMDRVVPAHSGRAYRRLTLADRSYIQAARSMPEPLSMRRIASELGVSASTVSRELSQHGVEYATQWAVSNFVDTLFTDQAATAS